MFSIVCGGSYRTHLQEIDLDLQMNCENIKNQFIKNALLDVKCKITGDTSGQEIIRFRRE